MRLFFFRRDFFKSKRKTCLKNKYKEGPSLSTEQGFFFWQQRCQIESFDRKKLVRKIVIELLINDRELNQRKESPTGIWIEGRIFSHDPTVRVLEDIYELQCLRYCGRLLSIQNIYGSWFLDLFSRSVTRNFVLELFQKMLLICMTHKKRMSQFKSLPGHLLNNSLLPEQFQRFACKWDKKLKPWLHRLLVRITCLKN